MGDYNCGLMLHGKMYGKPVDLLILHCIVAWELWSLVICLCLNSVNNLLASWKGNIGNTNSGDIWMILSLCLMWCLCLERKEFPYFWRERITADPAEVSISQDLVWMDVDYCAIFSISLLGFSRWNEILRCWFVHLFHSIFYFFSSFCHFLCILPLY